ncbi:MAG TPA: hypothetical protein VFS42_04045 [Burkholderiaceae bacterium]|nr:hypothetical protein [Burkholderiaceae bacterium]
MRASTRRPALSFEVAPPRAASANRTDIGCFIGTVARRSLARAPLAMPVVLARWLRGLGFARINGVAVETLSVDLGSATAFVNGVVEQSASDERDALANTLGFKNDGADESARKTKQLEQLVHACATFTPLPENVVNDLAERGWTPRRLLGNDELAAWLRVQRLLDLPIAIESFDVFDVLFAWDERPVMDRAWRVGDPRVATSLGLAVRAFFGEGGQRVWVVRTGSPVGLFASVRDRFAACFPDPRMPAGDADAPTAIDLDDDRVPQLPGIARIVRFGVLADVNVDTRPVSSEPAEWHGLEHVYGLEEVAFAAMPDLVDACAQAIPPEVPPPSTLTVPEAFHDCVQEIERDTPLAGRRLPAPRLTSVGLNAWRKLVAQACGVLVNEGRPFHRRDVLMLASLPLVGEGRDVPAPTAWLTWMDEQGWLARENGIDSPALMTDRLQLAWPWLVTREADLAQGGVEAPEGTLAGVLARGALQRGSFRSISYQPLIRALNTEPVFDETHALEAEVITRAGTLTLGDRVCVLGFAPRGMQVLSDVTCSADARMRQGAVRRLVNVVMQAARVAGDEFAFDINGEALWARVRERMNDLGRVLLAAGALSTDGVPFSVRCGRDTMTQNDLDAGRLIAEIELLAAQPIQRIVVVLALRDAVSTYALRAA